jgi:hypothetical protein
MLRSLLPKAHHKVLSLPLLGSIADAFDAFDDWLAANGFTQGSRRFSIRMLRVVIPIYAAAASIRSRS